MNTKHISQPEYDQLSDREKAGYKEVWQFYYASVWTTDNTAQRNFKTYQDYKNHMWPEIETRLVYVPIHPTDIFSHTEPLSEFEQSVLNKTYEKSLKAAIHPTPDREPEEKKTYEQGITDERNRILKIVNNSLQYFWYSDSPIGDALRDLKNKIDNLPSPPNI